MNKSSNVIDLNARLKSAKEPKKDTKAGPQKQAVTAAPVVDMTERRMEMIMAERRQVRRTILSEFIGAFIIVPQKGLQKVALYDISENGLAFDLEFDAGTISVGDEIAMRVYMNQQTYFPFVARIANAREISDEQVTRHGVNFVKGTVNDEALYHFVKFIETVSASLQTDHGDVMVSNLKV